MDERTPEIRRLIALVIDEVSLVLDGMTATRSEVASREGHSLVVAGAALARARQLLRGMAALYEAGIEDVGALPLRPLAENVTMAIDLAMNPGSLLLYRANRLYYERKQLEAMESWAARRGTEPRSIGTLDLVWRSLEAQACSEITPNRLDWRRAIERVSHHLDAGGLGGDGSFAEVVHDAIYRTTSANDAHGGLAAVYGHFVIAMDDIRVRHHRHTNMPEAPALLVGAHLLGMATQNVQRLAGLGDGAELEAICTRIADLLTEP